MLMLFFRWTSASCALSNFSRLIAFCSSSSLIWSASSSASPCSIHWEYIITFGCWFHGGYIKLYFTLLTFSMGAPRRVILSSGTRMKSLKMRKESRLVNSSMIISHLAVLSLSPVDVSGLMIVSTSLASVRRSDDKDRSSIKPISRSESSSLRIGWIDLQNSNELSGSPCFGLSLDGIVWLP